MYAQTTSTMKCPNECHWSGFQVTKAFEDRAGVLAPTPFNSTHNPVSHLKTVTLWFHDYYAFQNPVSHDRFLRCRTRSSTSSPAQIRFGRETRMRTLLTMWVVFLSSSKILLSSTFLSAFLFFFRWYESRNTRTPFLKLTKHVPQDCLLLLASAFSFVACRNTSATRCSNSVGWNRRYCDDGGCCSAGWSSSCDGGGGDCGHSRR